MSENEPLDAQALESRLLTVARAEVDARGWPWLEPVEIKVIRAAPGARRWEVRTNTHARGRNVRLVISEPAFTVEDAGYLSR